MLFADYGALTLGRLLSVMVAPFFDFNCIIGPETSDNGATRRSGPLATPPFFVEQPLNNTGHRLAFSTQCPCQHRLPLVKEVADALNSSPRLRPLLFRPLRREASLVLLYTSHLGTFAPWP